MSDYQPTYFDIHKTKHLQFAYKKLILLNPTSHILHEIITSGFTTLQGKVYRGSFPYLVRDHGPSGITHNEKKYLVYLDWLTKSNWGAEYYSMINSFNQYITESHQTIVRYQDLHFAHLKYLRKELINNLYLKESMIIKIIVYFMTRIEVILNVKVLFLKITKIYKKLFYKIVIKNNLIIKNKKIAKSNYDFIKLIDFIRKNN